MNLKNCAIKFSCLLTVASLALTGCVGVHSDGSTEPTDKRVVYIISTTTKGGGNRTTAGYQTTTTNGGRTTTTTATKTTTTKTTASTTAKEYKPVSSGTWKQERFYLSSCICPSDEEGLKKYAEAGYNLAELADLGVDGLHRALGYCEQFGIYALPINKFRWNLDKGLTFNENFVRNSVYEFDKYDCLIGYSVRDEITPGENYESYNVARRMIGYLDKWDPAALKYLTLLPSYGVYTWSKDEIEFDWNAGNYEDYVEDFIQKMNPQVLSFDYYPYLMGMAGDTSDWHRDMGLYRKKALEHNLPFWYYYQAEKIKDHGTKPTDAEIRYQMYYGLACGAKELSAWNATGDAMASDEYFKAAKVRNKEIMAVGTYLFDKTTTHYYHTGAAANYQEEFYLDDLSKSSLIASAPDRVIMSVFTDGKTDTDYLLIVNKNTAKAMTGTLTLKSNKTISYFDHATEKEVAVGSGNSISVSLPAGGGIVYVLK